MLRFRDIVRRVPDGRTKHVLRQFNMAPKGLGRAASVLALANALGFLVERRTLPKGQAGFLEQDAFATNGYCIVVNKDDGLLRQRFTVIHEIGHYLLHSDHSDPLAEVKFRDRASELYLANEQKEEREADEFVASLLFDNGALAAARTLFADDDEKLTKHFGVSTEVIRIARRQF